MNPPCPRCGGMVQFVEDRYGPYLQCFMGCWQLDLHQSNREELNEVMHRTTANNILRGTYGERVARSEKRHQKLIHDGPTYPRRSRNTGEYYGPTWHRPTHF